MEHASSGLHATARPRASTSPKPTAPEPEAEPVGTLREDHEHSGPASGLTPVRRSLTPVRAACDEDAIVPYDGPSESAASSCAKSQQEEVHHRRPRRKKPLDQESWWEQMSGAMAEIFGRKRPKPPCDAFVAEIHDFDAKLRNGDSDTEPGDDDPLPDAEQAWERRRASASSRSSLSAQVEDHRILQAVNATNQQSPLPLANGPAADENIEDFLSARSEASRRSVFSPEEVRNNNSNQGPPRRTSLLNRDENSTGREGSSALVAVSAESREPRKSTNRLKTPVKDLRVEQSAIVLFDDFEGQQQQHAVVSAADQDPSEVVLSMGGYNNGDQAKERRWLRLLATEDLAMQNCKTTLPYDPESESYAPFEVLFHHPEILEPQKQVMTAILEACLQGKSCVLESPTGTGKTAALLCAALEAQRQIARNNKSRRAPQIIYCTRTLGQVNQIPRELAKSCYRPTQVCLGRRDFSCVNQQVLDAKGQGNLQTKCVVARRNARKEKDPALNRDERLNDDQGASQVAAVPTSTPTATQQTERDASKKLICHCEERVNSARFWKEHYKDVRPPPGDTSDFYIRDIEDGKKLALANYSRASPTSRSKPVAPSFTPNESPDLDLEEDAEEEEDKNVGHRSSRFATGSRGKNGNQAIVAAGPAASTSQFQFNPGILAQQRQVFDRRNHPFGFFPARPEVGPRPPAPEDYAVCSYYLNRYLQGTAQIVICPYQYLTDPNVRAPTKLVLKDSIIVVDEAHNIEGTCRDAGSVNFSEQWLDFRNDEVATRSPLFTLHYHMLEFRWFSREKPKPKERQDHGPANNNRGAAQVQQPNEQQEPTSDDSSDGAPSEGEDGEEEDLLQVDNSGRDNFLVCNDDTEAQRQQRLANLKWYQCPVTGKRRVQAIPKCRHMSRYPNVCLCNLTVEEVEKEEKFRDYLAYVLKFFDHVHTKLMKWKAESRGELLQHENASNVSTDHIGDTKSLGDYMTPQDPISFIRKLGLKDILPTPRPETTFGGAFGTTSRRENLLGNPHSMFHDPFAAQRDSGDQQRIPMQTQVGAGAVPIMGTAAETNVSFNSSVSSTPASSFAGSFAYGFGNKMTDRFGKASDRPPHGVGASQFEPVSQFHFQGRPSSAAATARTPASQFGTSAASQVSFPGGAASQRFVPTTSQVNVQTSQFYRPPPSHSVPGPAGPGQGLLPCQPPPPSAAAGPSVPQQHAVFNTEGAAASQMKSARTAGILDFLREKSSAMKKGQRQLAGARKPTDSSSYQDNYLEHDSIHDSSSDDDDDRSCAAPDAKKLKVDYNTKNPHHQKKKKILVDSAEAELQAELAEHLFPVLKLRQYLEWINIEMLQSEFNYYGMKNIIGYRNNQEFQCDVDKKWYQLKFDPDLDRRKKLLWPDFYPVFETFRDLSQRAEQLERFLTWRGHYAVEFCATRKGGFFPDTAKQHVTERYAGVLKIHLLHAEAVFDEIATQAHSIILASGTMTPLEGVTSELGKAFCDRQLRSNYNRGLYNPLAANHVVTHEQLLVQKLSKMVLTGRPYNGTRKILYKPNKRDPREDHLLELGWSLVVLLLQLPAGVLVFFSTYSLCKACFDLWSDARRSSLRATVERILQENYRTQPEKERARIAMQQQFRNAIGPENMNRFDTYGGKSLLSVLEDIKKHVSFETKESNAKTLTQEYQRAIQERGAALLFGVMRAKCSEGISFNDDNARAVILIGLPYPSKEASEVKYKQRYNDQKSTRPTRPVTVAKNLKPAPVASSSSSKNPPGRKNTGRKRTLVVHPSAAVIVADEGAPAAAEENNTESEDHLPPLMISGNQWYEQECFRAVNQALGRCIRHKNDYGSLILFDTRWDEKKRSLAPWLKTIGIRDETESYAQFRMKLKLFYEALRKK
ncbi:unnamed protein product [Amoebophrya sp. A120]|nr:unnamed protein product [Amoebophrya sp. A120]|eukprot:GSA120T00023178001.1